MQFPSSVLEYTNILTLYPNAPIPSVEFNFEDASKIICDFIKHDRFTVTRGYRVKGLFRELSSKGIISDVSVSYFKGSDEKAYMTDDGCVYFSKRLLYRAGTLKFVTILTHELAHIYLCKQEGYNILLMLDKEFLREHENSIVASPIELYATAICISILEGVCSLLTNTKRVRDLSELIECEKHQIIQAKKSIGI